MQHYSESGASSRRSGYRGRDSDQVQVAQFSNIYDGLRSFVRRFGVLLVVIFMMTFGAVFVLSGRGEIRDALSLVASISPIWIFVLGLLQAFVLLAGTWAYQSVLRRQGHQVGILRLLEIHLQRVVIGAVTPVGGPASIYVLVRALRKHNVPDADSLVLASIKSITGIIAFMIFLVPALLLQPPSTLVLIAAIGMILVLAISLWTMVLILRSGDIPQFLASWMPERVLTSLISVKAHRMKPADFVMPTVFAFLSHVTTAMMLFAGLQAVGYQASINTVLIGYVVAKLFFMMAPVFQGIGIVEIGMVLALQQAGVPSAIAVSGALLYRIGDHWLPLSWGFIVHLVRAPIRQYLREAKGQAGAVLTTGSVGVRGAWDAVTLRAVRLSRLALVTEAPIALTAGVILIMASELPFVV
jgi:glycosyltransferase 2 family protein